MSSPLVVVLVVALGSSDEATAVARTVQDALGSDAVVVLREESNLDDSHVSRLGQDLRADALVRITWTQDDARTEAHLHLYATGARSWTDRDVTFAPDDPREERGRALGYGIASMVRVTIPPVGERAPPSPTVGVEPERPPPPPPPRVEVSPSSRLTVDARFQNATALGETGGSLGAEGALGYRFLRRVAILVRAGLRGGEIDSAGATATYLRLGASVSWTMFETRGSRPLALGGRLDAIALRQGASRLDPESNGGRWMAATATVVEAGWAVLPRGAVVGGIGVEAAFESTRILVDDREAARIAPVRILGELGIRVGLD